MRSDKHHLDYYVYVLFRETGVPFYVGKGRGYRHKDHLKPSRQSNSRNRWKQNIIAGMQVKGLDIPVVFVAQGLDELTSLFYERSYIKAIGRHPNGPLVNMTDGGDGVSGYVFSADTVERIAAQKRGRPSPKKGVKVTCPTALANIAAAGARRRGCVSPWKGKKFTLEQRAQMSASRKGKPLSPAQIAANEAMRGQVGPNRGKMFSAEVRANMQAAQKRRFAENPGLKVFDRTGMRSPNKGKKMSEEMREKNRVAQKNRAWRADSITVAKRQETRLFNWLQAQTPFTSEVYLHG